VLDRLLHQVPWHLQQDYGSRFPLLDALNSVDASRGTAIAREIIFLAAWNHRTADERRTAEYLLRNRHDVAEGRRSAKSLLLAARWAAQLDVMRVRYAESQLPRSLAAPSITELAARAAAPSAGDLALQTLGAVHDVDLAPTVKSMIADAVTVAVELAMRHATKRAKGPALLAMRTDARPAARLVTHLRSEFANDTVARNIARLLVGADGTPVETALLWWSVQRPDALVIPNDIRQRWVRYLRAIAAVGAASGSCPQPAVTLLTRSERIHLNPAYRTPGVQLPAPTRRSALRSEPVVGKAELVVDQVGVPCSRCCAAALDEHCSVCTRRAV
jgi:hypothetical protein